MVFIFRSDRLVADRIRKNVLPTTFLTFSIIDNLLSSEAPSEGFLSDLTLEPRVSMRQFFKNTSLNEKPDVYVIMLESISWDHYGFSGYKRQGITPNLDALASESLVFPRAYAIANHSSYSQTGTHASMYPLRKKQLDQFESVNYPKTLLFDLLSYVGYRTAFFSAQNEDWLGMKTFVLANTQIDRFFHSKTVLGEHAGAEAKLADEIVRKNAEDFLDQCSSGEPVFMYLNFQATHFPYTIPTDAEHVYLPDSTENFDFNFTEYDRTHLDEVINKYDNSLHYVDAQVGAFLDYLKRTGRYDKSLIVVTSDHGEAFYDHDLPTHGTALFDDQVRVAVLFKLPNTQEVGIRPYPISLIDLNPTILDVLGLPNHPNFQGRQVLGGPRNKPIYLISHSLVKSHGIIDYPWKYITSERDGEWLLNLEQDPDELINLCAAYPEMRERLKGQLRVYQQQQLYYYNVLPQSERDGLYPPQH